MTGILISELRQHLADPGNRGSMRDERVVVERRGRNPFALVPVEDAELLERLDDRLDLHAILASRRVPSRSGADVKQELAL